MKLIFEKSRPGRSGVTLPVPDVPEKTSVPENLKRKNPPELPEVSELDTVRHYTNLSRKNFGIDTNFYPLGSCTMKYNPKFHEDIAGLDGFTSLHPLLPQLRGGGSLTQGALAVIYETEKFLCSLLGFDAFTMQPLAGAHGELTGVMLIAAYHKSEHQNQRKIMLIPDSAHGTNPASAAMAGFTPLEIPTDSDCNTDMNELKKHLNDRLAGIMLTSPNTLGIFDKHTEEICSLVHEAGGLTYCDGANLNALIGKLKPAELGFDIMHINLHKTFATPHGGGGPGSGPVGVTEKLIPFLPVSRVAKRNDGTYCLEYDHPKSIGYTAPFYGNFSIILRAYAYLLTLGINGLKRVSENAVLNANYIRESLKPFYKTATERICMHECVFSPTEKMLKNGIHAADIAKALIDKGIHPPTIYFPLIIKEAIMIEPTETESLETLNEFITAMKEIAEDAVNNPEKIKNAPASAGICRPDETKAARSPDIVFQPKKKYN
jgi:glycine dehydrogenase subunit 2